MATRGNQDEIAPGVGHSPQLAEASKEARAAEAAVTKIVVATSAGALTLSIGFLLGEKRVSFPVALLPELKVAWVLLVASIVVGLSNWAMTSFFMNIHAEQLLALLERKRPNVSYFPKVVVASYVMFFLMVLGCLVGLGLLCDLAIELAVRAAAGGA